MEQHGNDDAQAQDGELPEAFAQAIRAAEGAPDQDNLWDEVEEQASALQRPDDVAAAYRRTLGTELSRELAVRIGQRAVRFHDEWFSEASPLVAVLRRVLEVDPSAEWAFHKLSLV